MQKEINFLPLDYDYFDFNGKNCIKIVGKDEKGKRVCILDNFESFFWVIFRDGTKEKRIEEIKEEIEKIKIESDTRKTEVIKVEVKNKRFLEKDVKALKVYVSNHKDCHAIADKIDQEEVLARREYDINITTKYITEKKLPPLAWKKVSGEILNNTNEFGGIDNILDVDLCLKIEKIEELEEKQKKELDEKFSPNILAFDIETDEFEIGKGEILMISLYGKNTKKVLTWKKCEESQEFVECFKNEEEMIEAFIEYVKKIKPDILTGYFSDGFDMPYLKARAEQNKIKLSLGVDGSKPVFARGRITSASIFGIAHIDLFRFIETVFSQYLQSETLGLDEVAKELLGEGKKEFEKKKTPSKIKEHEWKEYFDYNLQDSSLTYKLAEKLWPDMLEFTRIIQEPLFDITRDGMSQHVENYILHNLEKYNEIAEKRPIHDEIEKRREREKYEGAFVLQPKPGLYENIAFFDFTSYWPSIIVTYNLSKSTLLNEKEKDSLKVEVNDKTFFFSRKAGFFPRMLAEIIEKRKKYKGEYRKNENNMTKARSNAYKLLANASYGYQGFFGARYYCPEASAATTSISREFIKKIMEKTSKEGYTVLYADTDGFCFLTNKKTRTETLEFLEELNKELPGIMELELEDFYKRGIWVTKRDGEFGAKKKYALINEKDKLKIRGFETVRRDWCDLARELQNKILEKILKDGNEKNALELLKKTIKDFKERKIEREEIMIRTQLKKPLSEYKSITPHVIAAEKMKEKGMPINIGMLIRYFIAETREKKSLVREKVKLEDEKGEYNLDYYLNHQIIPAVDNIFQVFGINVKEIISGKKQMTLF
jgi:DNA polymerase I/DNA polymerase-2